jgi:NADPH:quinone reductase-like Zn-dependent oxidoreductase
MKYTRVIIERYGGPEVLKVITGERLPEPKAHEVRIKVLRTGAAFTDVMIRQGQYPAIKTKPPFALGYDIIGTIDKKGSEECPFKAGDLVVDLTVIGGYSQYICRPYKSLVAVPAGIDIDKAAALILPYVTAYQMLNWLARVNTGDTILVHGGGGAVGTALLDIGKILGLRMFATASTGKHRLIRRFGAFPIDYRTQDFEEIIQKSTGSGAAAVFDAIGYENFKKSFRCLKPGGTLVAYGFLNMVLGRAAKSDALKGLSGVKLWNLWPNRKRSYFYSIGAFRKKRPELFQQDLTILLHLLKENKIHPRLDGVMPLTEAAAAHQKIEGGEVSGKIVLKCN